MRGLLLMLLGLLGIARSAQAQTWVGRLDNTSLPAFGAWQSLESAEQAVGFNKRIWHLDRGGQEMLRVGAFFGAAKPFLSAPGDRTDFLAGTVYAVPGSLLDWALGTKMGDAWLPQLKTGILCAHDLSRPKELRLRPNFVGVGAAWAVGG